MLSPFFSRILSTITAMAIFAVMVIAALPMIKSYLISWDPQEVFAFGNSPVGDKGPSCFKDYLNWNNSLVYKPDSTWNLDLVPVAERCDSTTCTKNVVQTFQDINGDGLPDFIFSHKSFFSNLPNNSLGIWQCVALNTGSGWSVVHRCVVDSQNRYYGDCAG